MTALIGVADDAGPDAILREAEALSAPVCTRSWSASAGSEPSQWLEEQWGPVVPRLASIG